MGLCYFLLFGETEARAVMGLFKAAFHCAWRNASLHVFNSPSTESGDFGAIFKSISGEKFWEFSEACSPLCGMKIF